MKPTRHILSAMQKAYDFLHRGKYLSTLADRKVIRPFCTSTDFAAKVTLTDSISSAKAEAHAARVTRVVVVGIACRVDIAEVVGVALIRRAQPPPNG